jgi:hypothetical protein
MARTIPPARCVCGHAQLMHEFVELSLSVACLARDCRCEHYRERP